MGENELMVTIPMERYESLLKIETKANVLSEVVKKSKYSVDRKDIATILGFDLPAEPKEKEEDIF